MTDKKDVSNEEIKRLIENLSTTFQYSITETADVLQMLAMSIKNISRRLDQLEDQIYNDMEDDEFLN